MSRLARGLANLLVEERSTLKDPADWLVEAFGGARSWSGVPVGYKNVLGLDAVYSAVRLLADTIGSLPLNVYEEAGRDTKLAQESQQWEILHDEPNSQNAADQVWQTVVTHLNLWGNAYLYKHPLARFGGPFLDLWPVEPYRVIVQLDSSGQKQYRVTAGITPQGDPSEVQALEGIFTDSEILHIPGFGYNGVTGLSPLRIQRQTFGTVLAREEWEGTFYANNATPATVITHPSELSPAAQKQIKKDWETLFKGAGNSGGTAVLEEGATVKTLTMPLVDMQFVEMSRLSVNKIARVFRVPAEMIGGDRDASMTYSTVEGQGQHFVTFSLMPWLRRIENALNRDAILFPGSDDQLCCKFDTRELMRGDMAARGQWYRWMRELGAYSPNDILAHEGEPLRTDPGGDTYSDVLPGTAHTDTGQPITDPANPDKVTPEIGPGGSNGVVPPQLVPARRLLPK